MHAEPPLGVAARSRRVRNDIEGLRALAVLSVLANHAFPKALPGGFAGVDIFFVISGYLIGRHLLQDIQAGRLSFLGFYAKRARRIFPALALMLIFVWGVGWRVLSAPEFAGLGRHVAAAAVFSNNILLWSQSGYFDAAAIDKPLLHLWSLGIEEQFYLLVPAMLWAGTRGAVGSIRWVARLGALSLLATMMMSNLDYFASFYLLHTRFWELGAGVVLAQAELRMLAHAQQQGGSILASKRDVREILLFSFAAIFVGILMLGTGDVRREWDAVLRGAGSGMVIAVAFATVFLADRCGDRVAFDQLRSWRARHATRLATAASMIGTALVCISLATLTSTHWPGVQTVLPVVGAALFIAATPMASCNRLLAWKPLVVIGGISYPLYLWHWPVIVIWRLLSPDARGFDLLIPLTLSFVLSWLTTKLLEEPVRFGKLGAAKFAPPPLRFVILGLAAVGLLGSLVVATNGVPSRFPPRLQAVADWSEVNPDVDWRVGHCYIYLGDTKEFSGECTPVKQPGVPLILLWGDSHAAHLYPGLADLQLKTSFDIAQWTSAGCPPTMESFVGENSDCPRRRTIAMAKLTQLEPDTIVLGGAWERYLESGDISRGDSRCVVWDHP